MTSEATRAGTDVVAAWPQHFSAHDVDQLASLYTDDGVYEDAPWGHVWRGTTEVRAMLDGFVRTRSDLRMERTSAFVAGDWAARGQIVTATQVGLPDRGMVHGSRFLRGTTIMDLQPRKIRRNTDY